MKAKKLWFVIGVLVLLGGSGALWAAAPPSLLNYQGVLRSASGAPEEGDFDMVFRFYDADGGGTCVGGTLLLTDSHLAAGTGAVTVTGGLFNAQLGGGSITAGSASTLAAVFRDNTAAYLEVQVSGETLCPRARVLSAAYSLQTRGIDVRGGNVGIGTTSPSEKLEVIGNGRFTGTLAATSDVQVGGSLVFADGTVQATAVSLEALEEAISTLQQVQCEHLFALGIDSGILTAGCEIFPVPPSKTIFVTSGTFDGNLGGLAGADTICQEFAELGGLSGTYRAWLSSTLVDARDRLTHNPGPYRLPTGTIVAQNWASLRGALHQNPIDVTETGAPVPSVGLAGVWTATNTFGTVGIASQTCGDWTSTVGEGKVGLAQYTNSLWTRWSFFICSSTKPLYCIEQ